MIEIYEGRLGGGKSYSAVEAIARHLSLGLTVATNIEIHREPMARLVADRHGVEMLQEQLIDLRSVSITDFHRVTPQGESGAPVLVVIDECHLQFNARDWDKTSRELLAFLTQSRKQHTDIIFISQSAENIDKQFRRLIQYVWRFRDLERWSLPMGIGWPMVVQILTCGISDGRHLLAVKFDYDGKTVLQRSLKHKDRGVFAAYNTNALLSDFQRSGTAQKMKLNKAKLNAFALVRFLAALVGISLCAVWVWSKMKKEEPVASPAPQKAAVPSPAPSVVVREAPAVVESPKADVPKSAYDITVEEFRGTDERTFLKTAGGQYERGRMSPKGMVQAIQGRAALVMTPEGRVLYVVAQEKVNAASVAFASPVESGPLEPPKVDTAVGSLGIVSLDDLTPAERALGGYPARGAK